MTEVMDMHSRSGLRVVVAIGLVAIGALSQPVQAGPKEFKSTIAVSTAGLGTAFGQGDFEGDDVSQLRRACPKADPATDGLNYRFFDFGDGTSYRKFTVTGPTPLAEAGGRHDYDLDLYLFDDKCKLLKSGGATGAGPEKATTSKPARFAIVNYYLGPYPNIPVTLKAS